MLKIEITGETPLEALASLAAFGIHCMTDETVAAAANRILETERAKAAQVSNSDTPANPQTPADLKKSAPSADLPPEPYAEDLPHGEVLTEEPKPEDAPPWSGGEAVEDDAPTYTLEQIRARGTEAARTHGTPAVKAILNELGAKGMGTLDKAKYPAFMAKLDALEGQGDPNA